MCLLQYYTKLIWQNNMMQGYFIERYFLWYYLLIFVASLLCHRELFLVYDNKLWSSAGWVAMLSLMTNYGRQGRCRPLHRHGGVLHRHSGVLHRYGGVLHRHGGVLHRHGGVSSSPRWCKWLALWPVEHAVMLDCMGSDLDPSIKVSRPQCQSPSVIHTFPWSVS